jgi:hypothetical protein
MFKSCRVQLNIVFTQSINQEHYYFAFIFGWEAFGLCLVIKDSFRPEKALHSELNC